MEPDPISVIFVKGDSKGDRLLFRYPYALRKRPDNGQKYRRENPYSLTLVEESLQGTVPRTYNRGKGQLTGFTDEVLSNLFAVKQELAGTKFELKANDVRFVGHPTLLLPCPGKGKENSVILINVVFALQASASHSIVKCYYELSKRIGVALRHEEKRTSYVTQEMKTMITVHDDFGAREECLVSDSKAAFEFIMEQCSLARDLRKVYDDVKSTGLVHLRVNRWIELSFCLPQKVHQLHNRALVIEPETIDRCLQSVKPYHGLLLLVDAGHLLDSLIPDASPALIRLIKIYSPLKSLQTLSADADLTLTQVFNLAGHLVYWGKATFIYPICQSNVYMAAPNSPVHINSPLVEKFVEQFPNHSLIQVMSEYSLPISLRQKVSPINNDLSEVKMVVWLLQNRLLVQIHTYLYYMPTSQGLSLQGEGGIGGGGSEGSEGVGVGGAESGEGSSEEEGWGGGAGSPLGPSTIVGGASVIPPPLPHSATPDDLRLLIRLIVQDYLHGEHHVEEIMYLENLRRSQLLQIIDKFREVIITCESEDPAIAIFYPHSHEMH